MSAKLLPKKKKCLSSRREDGSDSNVVGQTVPSLPCSSEGPVID